MLLTNWDHFIEVIMKYMGSKARFTKDILPIILRDRSDDQYYVEPFAGGMNSICEVTGLRLANDLHPYLICLWQALTDGWVPPYPISREFYYDVKNDPTSYKPELVGWIGFCCSYSGKWWGGYAGTVTTKIGTVRDYQNESLKNIQKQIPKMQGCEFENVSYSELAIPPQSIVYCDPPYRNTTGYNNDFNHDEFYDWLRTLKSLGHTIFVSEYDMPDDFEVVWEKNVKSSLSANGKVGGSKKSIERLFTI